MKKVEQLLNTIVEVTTLYDNMGGFQAQSHDNQNETKLISNHNYYLGLHGEYWNDLNAAQKLYCLMLASDAVFEDLGLQKPDIILLNRHTGNPECFLHDEDNTILIDFQTILDKDGKTPFYFLQKFTEFAFTIKRENYIDQVLKHDFKNAKNSQDMNNFITFKQNPEETSVYIQAVCFLQPQKMLERKHFDQVLSKSLGSAEIYLKSTDFDYKKYLDTIVPGQNELENHYFKVLGLEKDDKGAYEQLFQKRFVEYYNAWQENLQSSNDSSKKQAEFEF